MKDIYSIIIIKPDAVKNGNIGEIITEFEQSNLEVNLLLQCCPSTEFFEKFYAEHKGKKFYDNLIDFMKSGSIVIFQVRPRRGFREHEEFISFVRNLVGDTDPKKAYLLSLRGRFGTGIPNNAVHASDSAKAAFRERCLFFELGGHIA